MLSTERHLAGSSPYLTSVLLWGLHVHNNVNHCCQEYVSCESCLHCPSSMWPLDLPVLPQGIKEDRHLGLSHAYYMMHKAGQGVGLLQHT